MSKVYYFNPNHDLATANGSENFKAPESAVSLADDLSLLPCWYAEAGSTIISDVKFSDAINPLSLNVNTVPTFVSHKLEATQIVPWGWDAAVRKFFLQNGLAASSLPSEEMIQKYKNLSHRRLAGEAMNFLRERALFPDSIPSAAAELHTLDDVKLFAKTHNEIVLKAPWSGSGKGIFWSTGDLTASIAGWCRRVIEKQGSIMAEKAYDRVQDFAMEFKVVDNKVEFAGYSLFYTEGGGIYRGNRLMSNDNILKELTRWVDVDYLEWIKMNLLEFLTAEVAPYYSGYIGVDMFVLRDNEKFYVNPVVEINLRMTMGMVARIIADRYVDSGARGWFMIDHLPPGVMLMDHKKRMLRQPMEIKDAKFTRGYLSLCPINENTVYRATVIL